MASIVGKPKLVTAEIAPLVPIARGRRSTTLSERFSGTIINQNVPHQGSAYGLLNQYSPPNYQYWQEFPLPKDYARGPQDNLRIPPLTGLQFFVSLTPTLKDVAALDWIVQRYEQGAGWQTLGSGTAIGGSTEGNEVWFDAYFAEPITIANDWIKDKFRFGVRGRNATGVFKEEVPYANGKVTVGGQRIPINLKAGIPYSFTLPGDTTPRVLHRDAASNKVYHSVQRGIRNIWMTHPNPLKRLGGRALRSNGTTPFLIDGEEASMMFRLLGAVADEGVDFLGNRFRNVVNHSTAGNVSSSDTSAQDRFWLSRPNPSQFSIESLYFDMTKNGEGQTMDRILIDPLTPGVNFTVYFSDEGEPGTDEEEWDEKLWERVPYTFQMKNRETHALPEPITAKYIKIDFTQLQAKAYDPGHFQKPITYKKHPKWVLDYFLLRIAANEQTEDPFVSNRVRMRFDYLDLAYNYYLDDLRQNPLFPAELGENGDEVNRFLGNRNDTSDKIDTTTLASIRQVLKPYARSTSLLSKLDYLPSTYSLATTGRTTASDIFYATDTTRELLNKYTYDTNLVSNLNRERVLIEKNFPAMFFFVSCRHRYRIVTSKFAHNRAYFAGIKEIALFRDHYPVAHDSPMYVESAGDRSNVERSDFIRTDGVWATYAD